MTNAVIFDVLDQAIGQLVARPGAMPAAGADLAELLQIAADLRQLPRTEFKARLGVELEWAAAGRTVSTGSRAPAKEARLEFLPGLLGRGFGIYPVRRANFAASLALHAALVAGFALGLLTIKSMPSVKQPRLVAVDSLVMPTGSVTPHGGGSGGDHNPEPATKGDLPRAASEQIVPPTTGDRLPSRLPVEATIVAPDLNVPAPKQMGDTLSRLFTASDGPGRNSGIGNGAGGGVGNDGDGPGHGPGSGGNYGGEAYRTGNGVTAPRALYSPEPEFSEEARKVKHQGTVVLWAVIGTDGRPHNIRVEQSLGMGLDEKALEAVRTWRFEPGTKDGHPVSVQMNIVVNFHLY